MALSRKAWIAGGMGARLLMIAVLAVSVPLTVHNHTKRDYDTDFYKLQSYSIVHGRCGGDGDGRRRRAADPRRRLPPLQEQPDDAQRPRPRHQPVRRRGGDRPAGQRRRRGVRRHRRRLAVRPPREMGRYQNKGRSHRLLQQGDRPRCLPPRRDGAVHGRHCRLRQAPGTGDRRRRRRRLIYNHVYIVLCHVRLFLSFTKRSTKVG